MMKRMQVVIIGAGASGLMCAIEAAKRGRQVLVIEHANKAGKKILMSGGGRCNFTNYDVGAEHYLSGNPHFCKSALSRYTQWDFLALVDQYKIPYHERSHGQLFCNDSAKAILSMLLDECEKYRVEILLKVSVDQIKLQEDGGFNLETSIGKMSCKSLVIATGGLSIPKMGATSFGYKVAGQFGLNILPVRAGLVPFTLDVAEKEKFSALSGVAVNAIVSLKGASFRENILFTHRGLSGPAILQISSYWRAGQAVSINVLPEVDLAHSLRGVVEQRPNQTLQNFLGYWLPKRLIISLVPEVVLNKPIKAVSPHDVKLVVTNLQAWRLVPNGTEGYRTAEVTLGGIDCDEISSKTFEASKVPGLYFIGEVIDVTGWLGGYNFQWAWSSGWCAGQYV